MKTVGILLASGQSHRFGAENKLLANFKGVPLCAHAANALLGTGISTCIAVVHDPKVASLLKGYECVECLGTQSDSLVAGVQAAIAHNADRIVVCLADMPFISSQLIIGLLEFANTQPVCACIHASKKSPPAVFSKEIFSDLLKLTGDSGAISLFREQSSNALFPVDKSILTDIDTIAELLTHSKIPRL